MTSESIDWDEDLPPEPEEEYQAFIRTLKRTDDFRLLFVRSSPAESEDLIIRVKEELTEKRIEVLRFNEPIDNLYEIVKGLPNREQISILFVQGLEYSLYEYEKLKFGENSERFSYSWKGIPPILNHLNLHRERFQDTFNICFVFLLRFFSLKYFIHRAPDFFDWRSSVFEFPTKPKLLEQESSRIIKEGDYEKYGSLTLEQQVQKILEIQELLQEKYQLPNQKSDLLQKQGILLVAAKEYEAALEVLKQAIDIKPDDDSAWNNRGNTLYYLGRYEDAIASYDKALEFKPDDDSAWNNRGNTLYYLGRYEDAIASYDKALEIKPDDDSAWYNRGLGLYYLGRYEDAVASYDKALEFKPDDDSAWNNRGNALSDLGSYEDAVASYDKALEFKPDNHSAWYNRGNTLYNLGRYEDAVDSYDKALEFKPNKDSAWYNRGLGLSDLGRYEDAVASYDKALEIKPDYYQAWYKKASCYALQKNIVMGIENLQQAINLNPEYQEIVKTDTDFDAIRDSEEFQRLIDS